MDYDVTVFGNNFRDMMANDRSTGAPLPEDVQIALGVFTIPLEKPHRAIVRETWMKQRGVCDLTKGQRPGCTVYVAFVVGSSGSGQVRGVNKELARTVDEDEARREEGMLILDMEENMNGGKSYEYFRAIVTKFPWVTHVAKCDMDTYPALHKLVSRLKSIESCNTSPFVWAGKPGNDCAYWGGCEGYLKEEIHDLMCGEKASGGAYPGCMIPWMPFTHHLGQFYLLSMPLVREIAVPDRFWDKNKNLTHEDLITAAAVTDFMRERRRVDHSTCVYVFAPDAWCHRDAGKCGGKEGDKFFMD